MKTRTITVLMLALPIMLASTCKPKKKKTVKINETQNEQPQQEVKTVPMIVTINTKYGQMKVRLYDETPKHRDNFVKLVKEGFYKDLLFHRVIKNFMIQGGDPVSRNAPQGQPLGSGGPGYTIPAEFNPKFFHKKGALAAARMGDQQNPAKASSGSQFYIVQGQVYTPQQLQMFPLSPEQIAAYTTVGGTPHLDGAYTVFGEVIEGLDVIDKIAAVPTTNDRPKEDVKMEIELVK